MALDRFTLTIGVISLILGIHFTSDVSTLYLHNALPRPPAAHQDVPAEPNKTVTTPNLHRIMSRVLATPKYLTFWLTALSSRSIIGEHTELLLQANLFLS
ncbi:hypothetical protein EDB19DRAFT_1686141 [Suillus lakei]|nr:hypothetical protein EDB19DRAFT_1686141 [Suillus lakei]